MSMPAPTRSLFTAMEKERLDDIDLDPGIRKRNNLIIRNKIRTWVNHINDIQHALHRLPKRQIKKIVTFDTIIGLLQLSIELLDQSEFAPIQGEMCNPYVVRRDSIRRVGGKLKVGHREAEEIDFERQWEIDLIVTALKTRYLSDSPAYEQYKLDKLKKGWVAKMAEDVATSSLEDVDWNEEPEEDNAS